MRRLLPSALLAVAMLLVGCGAEEVNLEGNWLMVGARVSDGTWEAGGADDSQYFLQIARATDEAGEDVGLVASGVSGCDTFQARVEQDGDDLDFPGFETAARPSCPESVPDALDGRFLTALEAITSAEMEDDLLVLRGPDTTLSFEKRS